MMSQLKGKGGGLIRVTAKDKMGEDQVKNNQSA